ncbi:hypothetical protein D3C81_1583310 [compost metagenome]
MGLVIFYALANVEIGAEVDVFATALFAAGFTATSREATTQVAGIATVSIDSGLQVKLATGIQTDIAGGVFGIADLGTL